MGRGIAPPLESATLGRIYFLNGETGSGSNHVSGSQALADELCYLVCVCGRGPDEVGTLVVMATLPEMQPGRR